MVFWYTPSSLLNSPIQWTALKKQSKNNPNSPFVIISFPSFSKQKYLRLNKKDTVGESFYKFYDK